MPNKKINRIKVMLAEKEKTNKWLAEQVGKDPATISKWCTNTAQPSMGHRTKRFLLVGENGRKTLKTNRFRHGMGNGQNISKRFPFT